MYWSRRARLVFSIHGIGSRIDHEVLVCSSFLEIRDDEDKQQISQSLIPVTDDGFVFFKNEREEKLKERFEEWYEGVLRIFLIELSWNL